MVKRFLQNAEDCRDVLRIEGNRVKSLFTTQSGVRQVLDNFALCCWQL